MSYYDWYTYTTSNYVPDALLSLNEAFRNAEVQGVNGDCSQHVIGDYLTFHDYTGGFYCVQPHPSTSRPKLFGGYEITNYYDDFGWDFRKQTIYDSLTSAILSLHFYGGLFDEEKEYYVDPDANVIEYLITNPFTENIGKFTEDADHYLCFERTEETVEILPECCDLSKILQFQRGISTVC